jgi:hypothetical protein
MTNRWQYLVGPWSYGSFIVGYSIFLTLLAISAGYWVRHQQNAWWRKLKNKPLNELLAIRSRDRLSQSQAMVIEWLIEFREHYPFEPMPEQPPDDVHQQP